MSDESRPLRQLPRIDYAVLHSTGAFVVRPPVLNQRTIADASLAGASSVSQPETLPEASVEDTFLDTSEQTASDVVSLASNESSNESTLTPASSASDLLERTLVYESPRNRSSINEHLFDALTEIEQSVTMGDQNEIRGKISLLIDDLNDYFDENSMTDEFKTIEDIDESIRRAESARTEYRALHRSLLDVVGETEYKEVHAEKYKESLANIKDYIKAGKTRKADLRSKAETQMSALRQQEAAKELETAVQKEATSKFLIDELNRMIGQLNDVFRKNNKTASNEEIESRESQLSEKLQEADRVSDKFQKLIGVIPESYPQKTLVLATLTHNYDGLMGFKTTYKTSLEAEVKSREIEKQKSFSTSTISIKLEKFKGFASELDVYSFRSEFEKLYLKDTPTSKLADLLKHNFLANPALGLVKSLDDISEIWERLQKAYGDPKTILSKVLGDVKNMTPIHKTKNSDELKDGLVDLINGIRDLIKVAKRHGIEAKLYNGEGLDVVYSSMGDNRVTRWLTSICEEDLVDEALWLRLLKFLERELKVQQEKALHFRRSNPKDEGGGTGRKSGHFTDGSPTQSVLCCLCNEGGHATTNGPNGILLVQYFTCRKWAESTAAQRFRTLRAKKFCHQCLYPGAKLEGKHVTGNCQSTFVCPHDSHHRHPCKKHILVCYEHRENAENIQLLEDYKKKFILNQKSIEDFSKNIKLSFLSCFKVTVVSAVIQEPDDDVIQPRSRQGMIYFLYSKILRGLRAWMLS